MKANVYSIKGVKLDTIDLPKEFNQKENTKLLAQAMHVYQARKHPGLSKVKTRGEVALTTQKAYRQKGTGRARHGAKSAPIFVGGGVAHGPKGIKRQLYLSKKIKKSALSSALSLKAKEGEVAVVSGISNLKKTKEAASLIQKVAKITKSKKDQKFTFALSEKNLGAKLALRNLKNATFIRFNDLNAHKVYFGGTLLIDKEAFEVGKKDEIIKAKPKSQKA